MKVKLMLLAIIMLLLPLFLVTAVFAQTNIINKELAVLPKDETVNQDFFATGETVNISGTINGDAYVAGGNVLVDGTINGDLLAAGGVVNILGTITQDVRVAGGQIIVSGQINGNLTVVGGSLEITKSASIDGSLVAATGNLNIFAPIGKNVNVGTGQLTIGSRVGSVQTRVSKLTLTQSAQIDGDLTYWSKEEAQIQQGAQITGKITRNAPPLEPSDTTATGIFAFLTVISLTVKLASLASALVIGLLFIKLFPTYTQKVTDQIAAKPLQSLGVGFLALILAPIIAIILLITFLGIPIALIIIFSMTIIAYLAKIFVSLLIGRKITKLVNLKLNTYWIFTLGLIIYGLVTVIPVVGFIAWVLAILTGTGALLIVKKRIYHQARSKDII